MNQGDEENLTKKLKSLEKYIKNIRVSQKKLLKL